MRPQAKGQPLYCPPQLPWGEGDQIMLKHLCSVLVCLSLLLAPALAAWAGSDPCSLLSQDEAGAILGAATAPPRPRAITGMAAGQKCFYTTSAPIAKAGGVGTVTISLYDPATMAKAEGMFKTPAQYFERLRKVKAKGVNKIEEIAGLGQAAFWEPGPDTLHVMVKDNYVTLQIKDMTKLKAGNMSELTKKISAHRKELTFKAMRKYLLPRLSK